MEFIYWGSIQRSCSINQRVGHFSATVSEARGRADELGGEVLRADLERSLVDPDPSLKDAEAALTPWKAPVDLLHAVPE